MPRGRRRKIEVPADTQPQFELGDTAEDIKRRRRGREERDERERYERAGREVEEESTEVESTQSSQKKGQMKSILVCGSDKEAIVEFVKQHKELYDKTNNIFKDKQKKEH